MAIALVMVPFLLKHLGTDGYGLIGLMGVIVSFSSVADLGLRQALGRELSEKVASNDANGFRALSSTALALYLGIAVILIVVGWVLAPWFVTIFKVSDPLQNDAILLIRWYGSACLFLSFVTPVFTAGLQSFFRFDAINMVQTISGIVSGLLLFACISLLDFAPLFVWAFVTFSVLLLNLICLGALYKKWCYSGNLGYQYINWRELKPLAQLGGYMYILQLTLALSDRSDPLIVSSFFGTAGVAIYQTGARLSQVLKPVVLTLSTQVHPLTTRFHVLKQLDQQRKTLILGTRYTLLLGVFFSAGIMLFAEQFCQLWLYNSLGDDYKTVAHVMRLWAFVNIFDYAGAMHWPALLGMKKLSLALTILVPSAIFNILFSIFLVGFTDLGIPGVLVATIITGLVRRPVIIWYVSKLTGLSIKEYIRSAYVPSGILFIMLLAFYYVLQLFSMHNWAMFILCLALFGIYSALVLIWIERQLLFGMWYQWRQK